MPSGIEQGVIFKVGGSVGNPPTGTKYVFIDSDGLLKTLDPTGIKVPQSSGWQLVERKVIPADVQSYDFTGLDGDVDEAYKISAEVIAGVGATAGLLSCRPNGLTTNQSANGYEVDAAGAPANDTRTELSLGFTDAATRRSIAEATLIAKTGSDRVMISQCRLPSISRSVSFGSTWTDTSTKITSLRIFSSNAAGLGIGSILTLYKRVIPG